MSKISDLLNEITDRTSGIYRHFSSAIIVAAGNGSRASTDSATKQMTSLCGIPIVARTISVFEKCPFINEIIAVARKDELTLYDDLQIRYGWQKLVAVVPGRETRQGSVLEGFKKISDRSKLVYIHDGVRCLVTEEMIAKVGHAALIHGAAFAACRPTETVKTEADDGKTVTTVDRNKVWLAQTPQAFLTEVYRASAYTALQNGTEATDDAALAESAGFRTVPVDCGRENVKITYPIDFAVAEAILKHREQEADR